MKIRPKNMDHITQTQNFKFHLIDLVALDELDLTHNVTEGLGRY